MIMRYAHLFAETRLNWLTHIWSVNARLVLIVIFGLTVVGNHSLFGAEALTRTGFPLSGQMGKISSVQVNPFATGNKEIGLIYLFDDGLRRTYVSHYQLALESLLEGDPTQGQRIRIRQNVAKGRKGIGSLQSSLYVGPFDSWGRREYSILTARGQLDISQGITEITPLYTRIEGLHGPQAVEWDMRVATSTIPRETLSEILRNRPESNTADGRLEVVRLLFVAKRYRDAQRELAEAMREFPTLKQFADLHETLKQESATLMLEQIKSLRDVGQHRRALALLDKFPSEGIAGITLVDVRDVINEYQQAKTNAEATLAKFKTLVDETQDPGQKTKATLLYEEVTREINMNNHLRLTDFVRALDDSSMTSDRLLALAVSGWLVGIGSATDNITVATSLIEVRDLVTKYLRSTNPGERLNIIQQLGRLEGGTPNYVAQILRHIKPPIETPPQPDLAVGQFQIKIPIENGDEIVYDVQLPHEYDPYRNYPTIVTLHGASSTPEQQLDWWCGSVDERYNTRVGQATSRHGYIVIAPHWARSTQRFYEHTATEHRAVLASLRDAMRRFAIDVDRVFLSGFSMGGDAAWDIALSHPDMWAGMIPIVATADHGRRTSPKYISLYWEHARYVPQYFVIGELDGKRLELNKRDFDRYLTNAGFDTLVVEYRGRGHEGYYDEIHRMFDWMKLQKRALRTDAFSCSSKRPTDNFFWCAEVDQLPSSTLIHPIDWPQKSVGKAATTSFTKNPNIKNLIDFETGAAQLTAYLSPEWVDFSEQVRIGVNGKRSTYELVPKVGELLEDVRQRGDRIYPFWIKIELPTGNRPS